jgi:hypothetical protein
LPLVQELFAQLMAEPGEHAAEMAELGRMRNRLSEAKDKKPR